VDLGIDNPVTQAAQFSSFTHADLFGVDNVFFPDGDFADFHACAIGFLGEAGTVFTPTTCGVSAPDTSQSSIFVDLSAIEPGSSSTLSIVNMIDASFAFLDGPVPLPEPSSIWLVLAALSVLAFPAVGFANRRTLPES
jgi:hypothetical protein